MEFVPFLNETPDLYFFCGECKVLVKNRKNHYGGTHFSNCVERRCGRSIKNWERHDPGVVPEPIPFDDLTIYCELLQQLTFGDLDSSTINQTEELFVPDDSPTQLALDEIFAAQTERFRVNPADRIVQVHNHRSEPNL
jgi:hypothetical protein